MARASIQMSYTLMIWISGRGRAGYQPWVRRHTGQTIITKSIVVDIMTTWVTTIIRLNTKRYFFDEYSIRFG
jgi:hypothetical protein